jgi:hypothetical protein
MNGYLLLLINTLFSDAAFATGYFYYLILKIISPLSVILLNYFFPRFLLLIVLLNFIIKCSYISRIIIVLQASA